MSIVIDTTKMKVNGYCKQLCAYAGMSEAWADEFWLMLMQDDRLYKEFTYYLEQHTFLDEYQIEGYTLSDLYVWQMDKYNLIRDLGKNPENCNKETLVLHAFRTLGEMKDDAETIVMRIQSGRGRDVL